MPLTECECDTSNVTSRGDTAPESQPVLTITITDGLQSLTDRLTAADGDLLAGDAIDVTYRFQSDRPTTGENGVVGVTENTTGRYIVEALLDSDELLTFIKAARRYADSTGDPPYTFCIESLDDDVYEEEKHIFLVYDGNGSLRRSQSLIPNDVEI